MSASFPTSILPIWSATPSISAGWIVIIFTTSSASIPARYTSIALQMNTSLPSEAPLHVFVNAMRFPFSTSSFNLERSISCLEICDRLLKLPKIIPTFFSFSSSIASPNSNPSTIVSWISSSFRSSIRHWISPAVSAAMTNGIWYFFKRSSFLIASLSKWKIPILVFGIWLLAPYTSLTVEHTLPFIAACSFTIRFAIWSGAVLHTVICPPITLLWSGENPTDVIPDL